MEDNGNMPSRTMGPFAYAVLLLRVPLLVGLVLVAILSDLAIPGAMREVFRYALIDAPYQLAVIALALLMTTAALRFSGEAIVELVAPVLNDTPGAARFLPRAIALLVAAAAGLPILLLAGDSYNQLAGGVRILALVSGLGYLAIGVFVALIAQGPHSPAVATRAPSWPMRLGFAALPVLMAATFAGAVLGLWHEDSGIAHGALERYVAAIVGLFDDGSQPDGALARYVYTAAGEPLLRYAQDVKGVPYPAATVSPLLVCAELVSLFFACLAMRWATAVLFDLVFPGMGSGRRAKFARRVLPPLLSFALGLGVAMQMLHAYLWSAEPVALHGAENIWLWSIAAVYVAVGLVASFGSASIFVGEGPWRESRSLGRRFLGAARRFAALDARWQWFVRVVLLVGLAIFVVFSFLRFVGLAQWLGPVTIILLWGGTTAVLFFPIAYLSHMTRIPFISILIVAAAVFSGFGLNDNHELRVARGKPGQAVATDDNRQMLDLTSWIAGRADWDKYEHYPVFLIATEGGGIRAAYFTASVLAALQERCPAFAQHVMAISGVSGGSLGAATFAALSADEAKNAADAVCHLDGVPPGPLVARARNVMSADFLSPLMGAMLFPDALQRVLPMPVHRFDRARALEYAVELSWMNAARGDCPGCDPLRLSKRAGDMYLDAPRNVTPHLFLNTTESGTGRIIPYATARVSGLATPFRSQAQIDGGNIDGVKLSSAAVERLTLQERMANDNIPLSTAAILSARFPYLTPAGRIGFSGGHYVDGGYFENSGTWLLSGVVQNLIGQQLAIPAGRSAQLDAAKNAVFVVIVIQSEPCSRNSVDTGCAEDATAADNSWNELLSPLRALLSTRGMRAEYSYSGLSALTALVEQLSPRVGEHSSGDAGCDYPVCAVTLRYRNRARAEIPLTWLLSSAARKDMDEAVDGMERAGVRTTAPPESASYIGDPDDINRVLGSYRRVLCLVAARKGEAGCTVSPP